MIRRVAPLAVVALLAGCGGSHTGPRVTVTPSRALVDTPVRITVSGLQPHERVVVRASTRSLLGTRLSARLGVRADASGVAHVPETLLASMAPAQDFSGYSDTVPFAGQDVAVTARGATAHLFWRTMSAQVERRTIRGPFWGDYFAAPSTHRRPAVLLFGGSEGGVSVEEEAALLASRGFPTLGLAYFHEPGLPDELTRIPLEYFERALRWLGRQPGVDPKRLVVDGLSRGSEAALLLGVHDPQVDAVVALVPGNVVLCGYPDCGAPAWTLRGKPIPFQDEFGPGGPNPIPVERIRSRVLLICGGSDHVWLSCPMAHAIVARRHRRATTLLEYARAGHGIGDPLPNVPRSFPQVEGYERLSNDRARLDAWPKLLRFLSG